jgi:hypothetical protein
MKKSSAKGQRRGNDHEDKNVHIHNFRSIADQSLSLYDVHLFVGAINKLCFAQGRSFNI